MKSGYECRTSRTAIADYNDEREWGREEDVERQNSKDRRNRYSFYHDESYMRDDFDFFQGSLFTTGSFRIDSTMFGVDNPFDVLVSTSTANNTFDPCNGDDCEECSIPEEYKHVENPIDALLYLGIQRVKPIVTTMVDD